jgi:C1A family cysteine protease
MKRVLAGGRPILAAIQLTANYGAVRLDDPGSPTGGRHAIAILGYSNSEAAFIVQDSRGTTWASGGQWWLPFSIVVSPESIVLQAFAVGYPN